MISKRFSIAVAVLCMSLAFVAGSAQAAETPTSDAYSGIAGQVGSGGENQPPSPEPSGTAGVSQESAPSEEAPAEEAESATGSGVLPFTGFQAGMLALVAVALIGCGVLLRRASRRGQLS